MDKATLVPVVFLTASVRRQCALPVPAVDPFPGFETQEGPTDYTNISPSCCAPAVRLKRYLSSEDPQRSDRALAELLYI